MWTDQDMKGARAVIRALANRLGGEVELSLGEVEGDAPVAIETKGDRVRVTTGAEVERALARGGPIERRARA